MVVYITDTAVVAAKEESTFGTNPISAGNASWIGLLASAEFPGPEVDWLPFWTVGSDRDLAVQAEARHSLAGISLPVVLQKGEIIKYIFNGYKGTAGSPNVHEMGESADISSSTATPALKSLTVEVNYQDPTGSSTHYVRYFSGAKVNSAEFTMDSEGELLSTVELVAANYPSVGSTRSTPTKDVTTKPYLFSQGIISLWGQSISRLSNFTLNINNNLNTLWYVKGGGATGTSSGKFASDIIPGKREYTLTGSLVLDTDTGTPPGGANSIWGILTGGSTFDVTIDFVRDGAATFAASSDGIRFELTTCSLLTAPHSVPEEKGEVTVDFEMRPRKCKITVRNSVAPASFAL